MAAGTDIETLPDAPTSVFLSYSRDDQKRALPIIKALQDAGFIVWWDGLLEGGERFSRTTEAALEGAKAVVVLWSKTSIGSHWVHDEATRGRDRQCLVPVSIDASQPPLGFRQFQTIDLSRSKLKAGDPALQRVVRAVAALHDQPAASVTKPTTSARRLDRRLLIGGGVATLVAAGIGTAWWSGIIGGQEHAANSVAVLPFVNMSGDPAQGYFSDGLAAEVRAELSRNQLLQVAAQASSNKFREQRDDAKAISRALGVAYLLDGNVRRSGDTVRISAELINGRSGFSEWSQSFDRPIADVFAVQDEIAGAVTAALSAQVARKESGAVGKVAASQSGGTQNVAAFDAFLRGRDLFEQGADEASDRAALAKFEAALTADPGYGAAHAARSRVLTVIANQYVQGADRRVLYKTALDAANEAVRLAPDSADAHSALGFALFNGKLDARAAQAPYERSFALGKGDADVLSRYAVYSARTGRFDAARSAMARSAALDPLNPRALRLVGEVEYAARRFAQAIPPIEQALAINPRMAVAHSTLGASHLMLGDFGKAERAYAAEPNTLFKLAGQAIVLQRQERGAEAQAALAQLIALHGDNSLYQQAQVFAQWGQKDNAMAALTSAQAKGDAGLNYLRNDPFLDPLRGDPAFKRLLMDLGFA